MFVKDDFFFEGWYLPAADESGDAIPIFSQHEDIFNENSPIGPIAQHSDGGTFDDRVWTGTQRDGTIFGDPFHNCDNWTNSSSEQTGIFGRVSETDSSYWTYAEDESNGVSSCNTEHRVYCFEAPTR